MFPSRLPVIMEDKTPSSDRSTESRGPLQHAATNPAVGKEDDRNCLVLNKLMRKWNDNVSTSGISKAKEQEITILKHEIKEQHDCLNQYQLILASIKDVIMEKKTISATTSQKVANIIAAESDAQFFQNCPMDTNPLGLSEKIGSSKDSELLFDETSRLQKAVEESIVEKCNTMKSNDDDESAVIGYRPSVDKTNLLNLNTKLDKAMLKYNESLLEGCTLLKEMCKYEVVMAKINRSHAECLVEVLRKAELKANLLECRINHNMYSETKNVQKAIDEIDTCLKVEMGTVSQELRKLKALKAKYNHLRETDQYEKIVREYREIKKSTEDKKWLLRQCE